MGNWRQCFVSDERDQHSSSWSGWQRRVLLFVFVLLNLRISHLVWLQHPVLAACNLTMAVILLAASALKL